MEGGKYSWKRGDRHVSAARLDRFLISYEIDDIFGHIKQSIIQRIVLDHAPIML